MNKTKELTEWNRTSGSTKIGIVCFSHDGTSVITVFFDVLDISFLILFSKPKQ